MSAKPSRTDLALLVDVSKLSAAEIAERYGVGANTARGWIAELRAERGETRRAVRAQATPELTRDEHREVATHALREALEALERMREVAHSAADIARFVKLQLELRSHVMDTMALAPEAQRQDARPELLERVRAATASAEAVKR